MMAGAEPVDVPSETSLTVDKPIQQIITHYRLNQQEAALSKRAAAEFAFAGMCRSVGSSNSMGAISLIMGADPDVPYQAAALAILGVYTRSVFGRQNSAVCAKIYDDATKQ
jgi:L-serine deaminase